ncbi:MAG: HD domain-containing phosphohydrolase [Nitrospinota bacterium]
MKLDISGPDIEHTAGINERDLYKELAEQVLQHDSAIESFDVLLQKTESALRVKKCGILTLDDNKEDLELLAFRCEGRLTEKSGAVLPLNKTPFQKIIAELRPLILAEPCEKVIFSKGESVKIAIGGPMIAAPLIRQREGGSPDAVGIIFVCEPVEGRDALGSDDLRVVSTLASMTSVIIQHFDALETSNRAQMEMDNMVNDLMTTFETLQQKTALIEQVNRISVRINSMLDLDSIFDAIADYSKNLLMSEIAMVGFISGEGRIAFRGAAGISRENLPKEISIASYPVIAETFGTKQSVIVNEYEPAKHKFAARLKVDVSNFITSPIEGKEGIVAIIIVVNKHDNEKFGDVDAELLRTLSGQGQTAIENARLLDGIKQTQVTMMAKLAALAEKRDPETGEHLLRMQHYCRVIAKELAKTEKYALIIDKNFVHEIYSASQLHDIGKVGINDDVLLKPGKLEGEEIEIMKTHAAIGAEILKGPEYLFMAHEIAQYHHEKWDGTGYPRGAKGWVIPLSARIVAVADVYDALTSKRVYKEGFSHEKAMGIIEEDSGRHFDPDIVEALKSNIEEILDIKKRFK